MRGEAENRDLPTGSIITTEDRNRMSISDKINICYKNKNTIKIFRTDVPDHVNRGDLIGYCGS